MLYSNVIHPTPLSHQLQNATHNMRWLRVLKDVAGGGIKALSAGESDSSDESLCYIPPTTIDGLKKRLLFACGKCRCMA